MSGILFCDCKLTATWQFKADPVDELSNHSIPRAVESPVSEAGVRHWLDVVVEVYDVGELVQQVRNVSHELLLPVAGGGLWRRVAVVVVRIQHDVWLNLQAIWADTSLSWYHVPLLCFAEVVVMSRTIGYAVITCACDLSAPAGWL